MLMDEETITIYEDKYIYVMKDDNKMFYLTFKTNQTMIRFDLPSWHGVMNAFKEHLYKDFVKRFPDEMNNEVK